MIKKIIIKYQIYPDEKWKRNMYTLLKYSSVAPKHISLEKNARGIKSSQI